MPFYEIGGHIGLPLHALLLNKIIQFFQAHGFHDGKPDLEIIGMHGQGRIDLFPLFDGFLQ